MNMQDGLRKEYFAYNCNHVFMTMSGNLCEQLSGNLYENKFGLTALLSQVPCADGEHEVRAEEVQALADPL